MEPSVSSNAPSTNIEKSISLSEESLSSFSPLSLDDVHSFSSPPPFYKSNETTLSRPQFMQNGPPVVKVSARSPLVSIDSVASNPPDYENTVGSKYQTHLEKAITIALDFMKTEPTMKVSNNVRGLNRKNGRDHQYVSYESVFNGKAKQVSLKLFNVESFRSITPDDEYNDVLNSLAIPNWKRTGAAKSGSDIYWSADKKYLVKSLSPIEIKEGKSLIAKYCEHMHSHPCSKLVKYYGLFRISIGNIMQYFLVMKSVFAGFTPQEVYDLKGSLHGRRSSSNASVLKDLNWLERNPGLNFTPPGKSGMEKNLIAVNLMNDVEFLKQNKIIDYSLMIGIDDLGEFRMGIIDILTPYTSKKKFEYKLFGALNGKKLISCNPPTKYASRFYNFVFDNVLFRKDLELKA